jgi:hypothetical protein
MPTLKQGLVTAAISAATTALIFGGKWALGKAVNAIKKSQNPETPKP